MRPFGLVLAALLLAVAAPAQQAPPAAPDAAQQQALDNYLLRWEQEMQKVEKLAAQVARIDKDQTFGSATKLSGYAAYMKAGTGATALNLAMLELRAESKDGKAAEIAEKYVCTGTYIYQFRPAQKEIKVYELPKPKPGQVAEDNFLAFMFGMKAAEARRRYDLKLHKVDDNYVFIDVLPRFDADKADFKRARLVLNKDTFLPRLLWFEQGDGREVTWDIPRIQNNANLDRKLFDPPQEPEGWRKVLVPRQSEAPPPRVVRPSSP
jgi:TIGR03009 family protein